MRGQLSKMRCHPSDPVEYSLDVGGETISVNALIGRKIRLEFEQKIV